jgi:acetyltransferase-like isoleucine patch superfamily enzyme
MDSNGHPVDPRLRWAGEPPAPEDVRPVVIADGVWVGRQCIIFPGVKVGEGSVISAGSVVRTHVPPYSVVAGNPAKVMFRLKRPDAPAGTKPPENAS